MIVSPQAEDDEQRTHNGLGGLPWQVHKFGGTSLATADCFESVAGILDKELLSGGPSLAAVVSAMGGKPKTTDLLLSCVQASASREHAQVEKALELVLVKHKTCLKKLFPLGDDCARLLEIIRRDLSDIRDILKTVALMKWQASRISELVSGYGELWSAQILTLFLQNRHADNPAAVFCYLDARKVIVVDEEAIQDGAVEYAVSARNITRIYEQELAKINPETQTIHFIMTGYVASNTHGVATTLQRDGSDYSAAILGRLLTANAVTIWTDVDGVLSADPRRVPLAQVLPQVSYSEAMELAYFGAKVIHPKTMQPCIAPFPQIPIFIRNTFNASFPGSRIYTSSTKADREKVVCAFSSIEHMAIVNVEGSGLVGVPGVAKRLFGTLERAGVNVVLISQASSEHSITFATTEDHAATASVVIEEEFSRELAQTRISKVEVTAPCSIIAAVGDGMSQTTGCSGRFFSALGDAKINIIAIAQGCSERNISAVVHSESSVKALRAVHAAFRLSHTTIRVAIVGMNDIGESLLRLLDTERGALRATFDLDLQVCAVVPDGNGDDLVCLKNDTDASTDSITIGAFNALPGMVSLSPAVSDGIHATFQDEVDAAKVVTGGRQSVSEYLVQSHCTNHIVFDCTNSESVGKCHAEWLRSHIDVVTANNTGLSGSKEQRIEINEAENMYGKQSAQYLREVTVGGGLPVLSTLRSLLHSGDKIRRVDGILSVSLSYIMFRISPPPQFARSSEFDEVSSNGAYNVHGELTLATGGDIGTSCSFSTAVKEAIALGLMEDDPTKDLNNEYTSRVCLVLAKELGFSDDLEVDKIQQESDHLLKAYRFDYHNISEEVDALVAERVSSAKLRGCVIRQISTCDVQEKKVKVEIVEVPEHHTFAVTPPSCECVRFFTHRHRRYPLIVTGPSAGADSTASALLAELLQRMRGKAFPQTVALSRTDSGAVLHS